MTSDLTIAGLEIALLQRQPDANLIHHSDQGSQYTDRKYQALLKDHSIRASMNGAGSWYDNAPMESFFGTLKSELVHNYVYYTRNEAKADVFYYTESFYNRRRCHSAPDYPSPEVYEQLFHQGILTLANSMSTKSGEDRLTGAVNSSTRSHSAFSQVTQVFIPKAQRNTQAFQSTFRSAVVPIRVLELTHKSVP